MRCRFRISTLILTAAALAGPVGVQPSLAAAPVATYTMTDRGGLIALFVPDGLTNLVSGLEGAQAQLLDNGVLTITSPTLPPITGKWSASLDAHYPVTCFWAKTGPINLNGVLIGDPSNDDQTALCSVQVNAPRTDSSMGSTPSSPTPASFQLAQLWVPATGNGVISGLGILAAGNAQTGAAITALAAAQSATSSAPVGSYTMTSQGAVLAVFVADGAQADVAGLAGAQLHLLANGTFTITSSTLPSITGRWAQNGKIAGFWAKTDQIDFNAIITGSASDGSPFVWYSVQVNAPSTDGSGGGGGGSLQPASLQLLQVWTSTAGSGSGGVLGGGG